MSRRVKEFIEISDFASLDELIEKLVTLRQGLPAFSEAELRLKGDDVFGRKLTISFMREQTEDEAGYDERCATLHRTLKRIGKARASLEAQESAALRDAEQLRLWRCYGYARLSGPMAAE